MSLEQAILDHAAAIRELAAAIISASSPLNSVIEQGKAATKAETKAVTKKEETKKAEEKAKPEEAGLDYDKDVAPALTAYMKENGRQAGVDLMAKFGAKKGAEIKPEDYAAVVEACTSVV